MKCFILQLNNDRIICIYVKECIYKILQSLGNKDFFLPLLLMIEYVRTIFCVIRLKHPWESIEK